MHHFLFEIDPYCTGKENLTVWPTRGKSHSRYRICVKNLAAIFSTVATGHTKYFFECKMDHYLTENDLYYNEKIILRCQCQQSCCGLVLWAVVQTEWKQVPKGLSLGCWVLKILNFSFYSCWSNVYRFDFTKVETCLRCAIMLRIVSLTVLYPLAGGQI